MQEAAERATKIIQEREAALVQTFKDKGINVTEVDKASFETGRARERRRSTASATSRPTGRRSAPSSSDPDRTPAPARAALRPDIRRERASVASEQPAEHHTPITAEEIAHVFEEEAAPVDLSRLRDRGLGDARRLLGHGALRLPAVLHPLRAEQQPRLDRGDRHQLPGGGGLPRLGLVRAAVAAHPGRRALPLPAAGARAACSRRSSTSSGSASSPTPRWLLWRYVGIVADERMVTIDLPRGIVFYTVLAAFVLMLAARRSRWRSATGGAATRCSSAPSAFDGSES